MHASWNIKINEKKNFAGIHANLKGFTGYRVQYQPHFALTQNYSASLRALKRKIIKKVVCPMRPSAIVLVVEIRQVCTW